MNRMLSQFGNDGMLSDSSPLRITGLDWYTVFSGFHLAVGRHNCPVNCSILSDDFCVESDSAFGHGGKLDGDIVEVRQRHILIALTAQLTSVMSCVVSSRRLENNHGLLAPWNVRPRSH